MKGKIIFSTAALLALGAVLAVATGGRQIPKCTNVGIGPGDPLTGTLPTPTMTISQGSIYFTTVTATDSDLYKLYTPACAYLGTGEVGNYGDINISAYDVPENGDYIPGTTPPKLFPVAGKYQTYTVAAGGGTTLTLVFERKGVDLGLQKGDDPMICHDDYFVSDSSDSGSLVYDSNTVFLKEVVTVDAPTS